MTLIKFAVGLVFGLSGIFFALPAGATVMGVYPGDLIKLQNDHDPATHEDEVVYYFDKDWYRRPFPNRKVYLSWYQDWSGIKELSRSEMADIRLGSSIVYRPGTRLIKIPSVPKVYAVEPHGSLRWIESEAVAVALFGPDWSKRVDDVPESFFVNYAEGAPLSTPFWPTGTVVRRDSDSSLFFIDGPHKRHLTPDAAAAYRLSEENVVAAAGDLSGYADGAAANPAENRYVDTAQVDYIETLPPPQFDLPAVSGQLSAGPARKLLTIRVTAGQAVIIKKLGVQLSGPLWSGSAPNLTNLRFVTAETNIFGIRQLESPAASSETLEWNGAFTMKANTVADIDLLADIAAGVPAGSVLTVSALGGRVGVADGGNSEALPSYFARTVFAPVSMEIK